MDARPKCTLNSRSEGKYVLEFSTAREQLSRKCIPNSAIKFQVYIMCDLHGNMQKQGQWKSSNSVQDQ